jgi:hypothetical protein
MFILCVLVLHFMVFIPLPPSKGEAWCVGLWRGNLYMRLSRHLMRPHFDEDEIVSLVVKSGDG